MGQTVKIRDMVLGEGMPKICVPIVGKTKGIILDEAEKLRVHQPDMAEWRLDFYEEVRETAALRKTVLALREVLGNLPLLCTFRTKAEGGAREAASEDYIRIYETILESRAADAIDVELFSGEETVKRLIGLAHEAGTVVIGSNHDFKKTPEKEEIVSRLCRMQALGMDVAKMAVMPETEADVITLLDASREMKESHRETPVITMSMGSRGLVSRLTGEVFGAALTFGTVGEASAPGQIPVEELRQVLEAIHKYQ